MDKELELELGTAVALPPREAVAKIAELLRQHDGEIAQTTTFREWSEREDVRQLLETAQES